MNRIIVMECPRCGETLKVTMYAHEYVLYIAAECSCGWHKDPPWTDMELLALLVAEKIWGVPKGVM